MTENKLNQRISKHPADPEPAGDFRILEVLHDGVWITNEAYLKEINKVK